MPLEGKIYATINATSCKGGQVVTANGIITVHIDGIVRILLDLRIGFTANIVKAEGNAPIGVVVDTADGNRDAAGLFGICLQAGGQEKGKQYIGITFHDVFFKIGKVS